MELFNIMNRIYWLSYQDGPAAYRNFMKSRTHIEKLTKKMHKNASYTSSKTKNLNAAVGKCNSFYIDKLINISE